MRVGDDLYREGQKVVTLTKSQASDLLKNKGHFYTNMTEWRKITFVDLIVGYFLPPYDDCTMDFMMEIWAGEKKVLKSSEVGHIKVPRLAELSVKNLTDQAFEDPKISKFLPSVKPKRPMNRDWLFTVSSVNSL